tara:strand:+ start:229 stop:1413 length:1185 start_codon:yes stop_codon:yes gene_type:complete
MHIVIKIFLVAFFFEIILIFLVYNFKKDFKWILNSKDENPNFEKNKLKNFFRNSFDPILGWDRKKNTNGSEFSNSKTFFKISNFGSRGKLKFKTSKIAVFGDSFAFCRYVNDEETWEANIEKKIKSNVLNFGVGNYGLDQSFLKYLKIRKKIKSKIIIFNVTPETIARINSYWKHYREFGNLMAFKPFYVLKNGKLILNKIFLKKNHSEKQIYKQINKIKKIDIFYEKKFKKHKFIFPYSLCFLKNLKFYSAIFSLLFIYKIFNNKEYLNLAISKVYSKNIKEAHNMYKELKYIKKLYALILFMDKEIRKDNKKMILIISPQILDFQGKTFNYYCDFYKLLSKKIYCINLTNYFKKKNLRNLFLKDVYGGHLNKLGNIKKSKLILNYLKINKII